MIIIPARLKSSRFKEKILCDILGLPMFLATAKRVASVDEVVLAVDDEEVLALAKKHGFKAVLTSKAHISGTDRINEAARLLKLNENELIINIQADEPFIEPYNVKAFKEFALLNINKAFMCSCYKEVDKDEARDENLVKLVVDKNDYALYFSRSLIPFERQALKQAFKAHLGIYSYTVRALKNFCAFSPSSLEEAEKLEQLRVLENGEKIKMLKIKSKSFGIDTIKDYERAINENIID